MNDLSRRLGTRWPLIQAPMAGVQGSALAIAVSRAGALGSLPAAMLTPQGLRDELAALASALGAEGLPFNVNFFCHAEPAPDRVRERRWLAALAPLHAEFGIDPSAIARGPGRAPFGAEAAALVEALRPPVVSFHFGLPEPALLARVKATGATVLSSATTVEEARWLEAHGADAVIAQGLEAGGHRGMFLTEDTGTQIGTLALVPQVRRAVRCPVIAAGGVADAAGVRAALALGADGVQCGTAFLLCDEATTSAVHRRALAGPEPRHTVLTNVFTGRPARGLVNRLVRELGPMSDAAPAFPLAATAVAPLRAAAEARGSGDCSPLWGGQNASALHAGPAAEVVARLAHGFDAA